jgi:pyruvate dehydrogenase E1 component
LTLGRLETILSGIMAQRTESPFPAPAGRDGEIALLETIQDRLLWLSMLVIHHANHERPNPEKTKIGGHPASCTSALTILTALYFRFMRESDRIAVKPHASPVLHAAMYLLGILPRERLATLREFGGLQAYPSRTKDADTVDFSTGSVGLGAVVPSFAALVQRYAHAHFGATTATRFIAVSGDAELDEGNVWEAIIDESLRDIPNSLWIIDLNRQSLDRVVPGVRADRLKRIFAASGWNVIEAKYGAALRAAFGRDGGDELRAWIDEMPNEEYQSLIRSEGPSIRQALLRRPHGNGMGRCVDGVADGALPGLLANLGGHDLPELLGALDRAERETSRPTVIFAYTIKGWRLPIAGDPFNHSALLSAAGMERLRATLGIDAGDPWAGFAPGSEEARWCRASARRMGLVEAADRDGPPTDGAAASGRRAAGIAGSADAAHPGRRIAPPPAVSASDVPFALARDGEDGPATTSTQEAFGRLLMRVGDLPKVGERIVTSSPDVSVSTALGSWINRAGQFSQGSVTDYETGRSRVVDWKASPRGRHIELGISEMNLFTLLGQLGMSHEINGQLLFPIGTVYDPFICRGLDALIYGLYSGSRFIFAGTPSGVSLSPEGGAHQSSVTAPLGLELPGLDYFEPCFAVEVEWTLLEALRQCCDRARGRSTYLRLSTKPVDQSLMLPALARLGTDVLREQALAGGYVLREAGQAPLVHIISCGAMIPEAMEAAEYLEAEGVGANVVHLVSPRRACDGWKRNPGGGHLLARLIPAAQRTAPIVTVLDGAASTLAWTGGVFGEATTALGVDDFGQSGMRRDLYRAMRIDRDAIIEAAFDAVDRARD